VIFAIWNSGVCAKTKSGRKIRNAASEFAFMLRNPNSQETKSPTNPKPKIE
jgi:hypothetical protein